MLQIVLETTQTSKARDAMYLDYVPKCGLDIIILCHNHIMAGQPCHTHGCGP